MRHSPPLRQQSIHSFNRGGGLSGKKRSARRASYFPPKPMFPHCGAFSAVVQFLHSNLTIWVIYSMSLAQRFGAVGILAILLAAPLIVSAQTDPRIVDLLARVRELQAQLAALRGAPTIL